MTFKIAADGVGDPMKTQEFPMAQAKQICHDLFEPNPWIYWTDFLASDLIGWALFIVAVKAPNFSLLQIVSFIAAGLALYRAVIFVHELTHLKKGTFRVFHTVWNLLCGFPLMVPSMLYMGVHIDHHKQKLYGTENDHEYADFARHSPWKIIGFLATMPLAPAIFLIRFVIVTPISYIVQPLRKPLWELASSLAVGPGFKRPLPNDRDRSIWWAQEFMTFAYGATGLGLMIAGILPWKALVLWYIAAAFILFLNGLRTLAAHCYRNEPHHEMTFSQQFLDSIDVPGNPLLTSLWAPTGLRFHATHHLFPGMPYHHLKEANKRLLRDLPLDNPYPLAMRKGLSQALMELWHSASRSEQEKV